MENGIVFDNPAFDIDGNGSGPIIEEDHEDDGNDAIELDDSDENGDGGQLNDSDDHNDDFDKDVD